MAKPEMDLTDGLHLGKFAEYQCECFLDAPIRVLLDAVMGRLHVADRHSEEQFAATCLLL